MTKPEFVIYLDPHYFEGRDKKLFEYRSFHVSAFNYESGVSALKFENEKGNLILLPFQGQQIWSLQLNGRDLTMKSMFDAPCLTRDYLSTYGGFLLHCGATRMGVPSKDDTHPLHGELPNAPYQKVYILAGRDEKGYFIGLSGEYHHTIAFQTNYLAQPEIRFYENLSIIRITMTIENLKNSDMELMYLSHINFRPVNNGRLVYSAQVSPESVRVRESIPSHIRTKPGYRELIEELKHNPGKHHLLSPDLFFDPEVVLYIDYETDEDGWAHSLQIHPDGSSDYVCHRPDPLNVGVRWICRTPDQDALGIVLPATAEPEGYLAEEAKGNIKIIPPHEKFFCEYAVGALDPEQTKQVEEKIKKILNHSA